MLSVFECILIGLRAYIYFSLSVCVCVPLPERGGGFRVCVCIHILLYLYQRFQHFLQNLLFIASLLSYQIIFPDFL